MAVPVRLHLPALPLPEMQWPCLFACISPPCHPNVDSPLPTIAACRRASIYNDINRLYTVRQPSINRPSTVCKPSINRLQAARQPSISRLLACLRRVAVRHINRLPPTAACIRSAV